MLPDWNFFTAKTLHKEPREKDGPKYLRVRNAFVWYSNTSLVNNEQHHSVNFDLSLYVLYNSGLLSKHYTIWCAGYSIFTLGRTPVMYAIKSQWGAFSMSVHVPFTVCYWRIVLDLHSLEGLKQGLLAPGCKAWKAGVRSICPNTSLDQCHNLYIISPTAFFLYYFLKQVGVWGWGRRKQ